ncbi:hypothetical protein TNCV_3104681 [Trichonephila clavipes]|nr:hypothetical protein TNCV_3104681 [Trichonephila clavipes]
MGYGRTTEKRLAGHILPTGRRVLDMDVCKCRVLSWHGGTLNSRRAASPLMRLVAGDQRWETPDCPPGCPPSKFGCLSIAADPLYNHRQA